MEIVRPAIWRPIDRQKQKEKEYRTQPPLLVSTARLVAAGVNLFANRINRIQILIPIPIGGSHVA